MFDNRFFIMDVNGPMQMPARHARKMKTLEFKGHGIEGYDNVKKKFFGTWSTTWARNQPHELRVVREPRRPGNEDDGDRLHAEKIAATAPPVFCGRAACLEGFEPPTC